MFLLSSLSEEEGEEEEEEDDDEMEDKEGGDDAAIATDANEEDKREGGVSMQAATASDFGDAMSDEEGENMTLDQHIMHARALREKMRQQAAEDAEFPDEVDTPENVPARQRFARYRGLRSFRTSPWDPKENLPLHYSRTTAFENIKRATKRALAAHANSPTEVGMFVAIVTDPIPEEKTPDVLRGFQGGSLVVSGLLPNEHRIGVVHFRLQRHPDFEDPIRSKQLLLVHCGFRSFLASMIFSEDNPNHDKHKMDRFFKPHCTVLASAYAPITFPPAPVLVFVPPEGSLTPDLAAFSTKGASMPPNLYSVQSANPTTSTALKCSVAPPLCATGNCLGVNPDLIVLKKIVITGFPLKIRKRHAVVRYMFFNPEDVRWFKPVDLWTKRGRKGNIRESLGTHGAFKAMFDGQVTSGDVVCMSLYKRAFPKYLPITYCVAHFS
eukprot:c16644_g1_i2.p1 GENE.c16644_g1_i2~~c16644_g1_i2.p1  ORF type:complete len:439 (+),score=116.47 c16644_g1_i2:130-1446(+)